MSVDQLLTGLVYLAAIFVLLLVGKLVYDKLHPSFVLRSFDREKEIITDRNAGTGAVEAGNHVANGLIIAGAVSGEGDLITALAFWGLGQVVLILAGLLYERMVAFDVHDEIERDNVAVGVAFAGVLVAIGHVVGVAVAGDFVGWRENLQQLGAYAAVGLVLLPVVRLVTDKLLLPGVKLNDELVAQDEPNLGAGLIEAFSYVAAALLIGWAF